MAFSRQDNQIALPGVGNRVGDGFPPVADLHVFPLRLPDSDFDVLDDILGLLEPGIVGGDHSEVRQPAADFPHLVPALLRAVAAAAEHAHQPLWIILLQSGQQALQGHGIVGIIYQQREFVGNLHLLDAAFDLGLLEGTPDVRSLHLEMAADGDGAQGIVYAEPSGRRHMGVKIHQPCHMEVHPQLARRVHQFQVLGPEHAVRPGAVGLQRAAVPLHQLLRVDIVSVHDAHAALPEQKALTGQVFLEVLMLIRPDVVRLQVGEDAVIEHEPLGPVQLQRLRGHLHDYRVQACLRHLGEILLKEVGFRRGVLRMGMDIPYDGLYGPYEPYAEACVLQDGLHQVGCGGLALGASDADDFKLPGRVAEPGGRDVGHGISGVPHLDYGCVFAFRRVYGLGDHQDPGPFLHCLPGVVMAVELRTCDADEETARDNLPGIIDHRRHLRVRASL